MTRRQSSVHAATRAERPGVAVRAGENAWDHYEVKVVKVFTARTTSYPRYFLAQVETSLGGGSIDRGVDVYIQESKKGDWLWERSIAHPDSGWPVFKLDKDGYVEMSVDAGKLVLDPNDAASELSAYLTISGPGAAPPNEDLFDASIGTDEYRSATEDFAFTNLPEGWSASFTAGVSDHPVLIFPLKDGGALVNFGLATTTRIFGESDEPEIVLEQDIDRSAWDPRIEPGLYWEFVLGDLEGMSIVVPTKKSGDGLTAIPILFGPLSARGSLVADPSQYS